MDNADATRTIELLARESFKELTPAESALIRAAPAGETAFCGISDDLGHPTNDPRQANNWGKEREIRGELITWLCLDRRASALVHPKGLKTIGALVPDALDLSFVTIGFPLLFGHCRLVKDLQLLGARTRTISLQGSRIRSFIADGAVVSGAVRISKRQSRKP